MLRIGVFCAANILSFILIYFFVIVTSFQFLFY